MLSLFATLLLVPLVTCLPRHHHKRLSTSPISGKFDSLTAGQYSILNNLWGESYAESGSQSSQLISLNDATIAWDTTWTWTGGWNVKSYANVQLDVGINQQLSAISSMPSTWEWSQQADNSTASAADVSYDLFTSWSPGGSNVNEIMIWLANINYGPISFQYDQYGHAVPIATDLSIAGHTWNLYSGNNGENQVYSFLLTSGVVDSFSGDIYEFFTYLIDNQGVSSSQYLTTAQAGTEAVFGTATLTTSAYSLNIE